MPLSPLAAAAIPAGGDFLTAGLNALTTGMTNRAQRRWSEQMYNRQYQDNIAFWNRQNEYNSPQAQMKRYQEAGLNPNLIYGSGSSAGTASPINTPDVQPVQYRTPDLSGIGNGIVSTLSRYQDYQIKQAQLDNLKTQNNLMQLEVPIKQFRSGIMGQEFSLNEKLLPTREATEVARLKQIGANTDFTMNQQNLNTIKNAADVKTALSSLLSMEEQRAKSRTERAQIEQATQNLKKDGELKQIDIELRQMGIMPGSPAWINIVGTFFKLLMNR